MNEEEALDLLDLVRSCNYKCRVHQLDAPYGEWIVILSKDGVHVWNTQDWHSFLQEEEAKHVARRKSA